MRSVHLDPNLPWYVARSAGFVAWGLVSAAVIWGLAFSGKLARRRPPAAWVLDLHRFLGGSAVAFTGLHLLGLSLDRYTNFGVEHLLVPFTSTYRTDSVAWGVVGMWLLLTIEATSLMMKYLPKSLWRRVHMASFVVFGLATVHGWNSGTDSTSGVHIMFLSVAAVVVSLVVLRLIVPRRRARARKAARPAAVPYAPSLPSVAAAPMASASRPAPRPARPRRPDRPLRAAGRATPSPVAATKSGSSRSPVGRGDPARQDGLSRSRTAPGART